METLMKKLETRNLKILYGLNQAINKLENYAMSYYSQQFNKNYCSLYYAMMQRLLVKTVRIWMENTTSTLKIIDIERKPRLTEKETVVIYGRYFDMKHIFHYTCIETQRLHTRSVVGNIAITTSYCWANFHFHGGRRNN